MNSYVLFKMWGPFRQSLIDGHLFYVEQARKRLLSQFDDIDEEADRAVENWQEKHAHLFNPDQHDPASFQEAAHEAGIEFYQLLSDMRDQTRLSVVAGMFHEWDKQLRDWLVREIQHWHAGDKVASKIWAVDFGKLMELLEGLGWNFRSMNFYSKLDACRLVVNVYKHGEGKSLEDLKGSYPEYLDNPFNGIGEPLFGIDSLDHTHLMVSDEQFEAFSDAIVEFWQGVPEHIFDREEISVPDWFQRAVLNDQGINGA